jgi:hypothetical protein
MPPSIWKCWNDSNPHGQEKAGVDFVAVDTPNANRLTIGIMAMVAENLTTNRTSLILARNSS